MGGKHLQQDLNVKESRIQQMRNDLDRLRHRTRYWKTKCDHLKQSSGEEVADVNMQRKRN